jgi:transcriptional regulator with XRE-family HTH domain
MGLTIEALSAVSGVSTRQLLRIEAGEPTSMSTARKLAGALGRTIGFLFPTEPSTETAR